MPDSKTESGLTDRPRVVLDANVLYGLPLRDTLLTLASEPFALLQPTWSNEILAEVQRNLVARGRLSASQAARAVAVMQKAFPEAAIVAGQPLIDRMPNHPKDRHVLAVAVVIEADRLVTYNLRDFAAAGQLGIAAVHPDDFLCELHNRAADIVCAAVAAQMQRLTAPAMTWPRMLVAMERARLSKFAARLRR